METPNLTWEGASGRTYRYWVHPLEARFKKIAGNFIFARRLAEGAWEPLYIGEIRSFDDPLLRPGHRACVQEHGATHLHVHFSSPSPQMRQAERDDLIARWQPVCNGPP